MAVFARGGTFCRAKRVIPASERRTLNVEDLWGRWLLRVVARPCDCRAPITLNRICVQEIIAYLGHSRSAALPREMRIKDIVAHLFDYHVMEKRNWTLDRLVAWVQPLEPSEPAEVPAAYPAAAPECNFSAQAAAWQRTREAFEAKLKPEHRRFARRAQW
jgi:hypothetical protein